MSVRWLALGLSTVAAAACEVALLFFTVVLIATVGLPAAFATDALTFAVSIATLLAIKTVRTANPPRPIAPISGRILDVDAILLTVPRDVGVGVEVLHDRLM